VRADHGPRGSGGAVTAQRAPFTHAEVGQEQRGVGSTRGAGSAGGRGRARPRCGWTSAQMASQQVERTAELQDLEVRAELDRCICGCERECSAGGRLGSIP
jgi:hypothetical protein